MKKKIIALGLAFVMSFSSFSYAFSQEHTTDEIATNEITANEIAADEITANETVANEITSNEILREVTKTADLKTSIVFSYPENAENTHNKNIVVTLEGVGSISLTKDVLTSSTTKIGEYNVEISTNFDWESSLIKEVEFKIIGLDRADNYKLTFSGAGHKSYTTNSIDLTKSNKHIIVQTNNTTFTIGDVNEDGVVNSADIAILEQKINENSTDRKYDLNGDGVININDIAYVNHHINTNGAEISGSYEYFVEEVIDDEETKKLLSENVTMNGSFSDLADGNTTVTFTKTDDISKESPLEIPLVFENAVEMETIEIVSPNIKEGIATVETEEGKTIVVPITSGNILSRSSDSITISLGAKVAVKKVTISVTAVENADGSTNFVSMQEVRFLQDIGQDLAGVQTVIVQGLTATAESEKVTLTWKPVDNVTGYKVYFGESLDNLTNVVETDKTTLVIDSNVATLDNLTTYYFCVSAVSEGFESEKSEVVSATPMPNSVPAKPDFLTITDEQDRTIHLSWSKAKDAVSYNVYIRKKDSGDNFTLHTSGIKETKVSISGLENNVTYEIYVTAVNQIGESAPSLIQEGTPNLAEFMIPEVPTKNRMDNSNIINVEMGNPVHYNTSLYPDGFDPNWVIDGDYYTSWVARSWWEANSFAFTFDQPMDMDYIIWVPRLDEEKYRKCFGSYQIEIWHDGDDLTGEPTYIYDSTGLNFYEPTETGYAIFTFKKQENVKKIRASFKIWNGAPADANASEIIFYHYDSITDDIKSLFANDSYTKLAAGVTEDKINELVERVNSQDGFVVDSEVLLQELEIARGLLKNDTSVLGVIKDNIYSIDTQKDSKEFDIAINNFQPLGIVVSPNQKFSIYAEIPEGETVQLIPTQFFEEANTLTGNPITLQSGRNVITLTRIGNTNQDRGGSLYVTYSGTKADQIKLHILGGTEIPYIELSDFNTISKSEFDSRATKFIQDLEAYVPTLKGTLTVNVLNQSEISLPSVLLSLPANKILEGIGINATTTEEKVENLYNTCLAWEELIDVIYKTYGIDDNKNNGLETRQNIRYMKMFGGAFMYASGNHIGIGYDSVAGTMTGKPVSTLGEDATSNELLGWGIAHEIGHVMDKLGKAEITNNIFSLAAQTYDGKDNTLPSRLEISQYYEQAYEKVSLVSEGLPNNIFVQLVMYWQLHLAYDDGGDNSLDFYNQVYKKYRENDATIQNLTDMDKFAVVASQVANKDLTEFFTRWGVKLSETALNTIKSLNLQEETRAIYYLNDESRRQRLNSQNNGLVTATVTATATINPDDEKQVDIVITPSVEDKNILGYEIIRNNKSIGFTTTNSYTDIIGSANNLAFEYSIVPISILGVRQNTVYAGQVRIEYDKVIDPTLYTTTFEGDTLVANFGNVSQTVAGIILTPKAGETLPTTGNLTVTIKTKTEDSQETVNVAKDNMPFATAENLAKDSNKFLTYFNKPGTSYTDNRIWNYDAIEIRVEGITDLESKYDVSFVAYPGDNIEFFDVSFGKLSSDYVYGEGEDDVIKKDTLVIIGSYRGDPIYNTMRIEGRFLEGSGLSEGSNVVERDINGYSLFFAEAHENEISTTISDGIFIFVPDIQAEAELQGSSCDHESVLPTQLRAVLYRSDDPYGQINNRVTSNTIWITTPDIETMPTIVIN